MTTLHIEFETYSAADFSVCSLDNYAADPTTGVHSMEYTFAGGLFGYPKTHVVTFNSNGTYEPPWVITAFWSMVFPYIAKRGIVVAHNPAFELAIWNKVCAPKYGWPPLSPKQMRSTTGRFFRQS